MTAAASARQAGRGAFARLDARHRTPGAPSERARRLAPRWSRWEKNVDRFRNKGPRGTRAPGGNRMSGASRRFVRASAAKRARGRPVRTSRAVARVAGARASPNGRRRVSNAARARAGWAPNAERREIHRARRAVSEPGRTFNAEAPGGRPEASATSSPLPNPALTLAPLPTQAKDPEPDPNPPRGSARNSGLSRRRLDLPVENIGDFIGRGGARRRNEKHRLDKQSTKSAARKVGAEAQTALGLVERRAFSRRAYGQGPRGRRGHWSLTDGGAPVLSQLGIIARVKVMVWASRREDSCARARRDRETHRAARLATSRRPPRAHREGVHAPRHARVRAPTRGRARRGSGGGPQRRDCLFGLNSSWAPFRSAAHEQAPGRGRGPRRGEARVRGPRPGVHGVGADAPRGVRGPGRRGRLPERRHGPEGVPPRRRRERAGLFETRPRRAPPRVPRDATSSPRAMRATRHAHV